MVEYRIVMSKTAKRDRDKIKNIPALKRNINKLLEVLKADPFQNPPPYEKLKGDLDGLYSRRINIQHRLVYEVFSDEHAVKIVSMWSHYEM